jgi:hypothetical protein
VQQPESAEPVLNADVWLKFTKDGSDVAAQARRGVGQNKLLYVASVPLDAPGSWHCTATAHWGVRKVQASGLLAVGVPAASIRTYSLYLVLPFLCIGILAVHQWRVWSMGQTRTLATSRGATSPGAE